MYVMSRSIIFFVTATVIINIECLYSYRFFIRVCKNNERRIFFVYLNFKREYARARTSQTGMRELEQVRRD